ncbi:MAG: RtcB family protein [Acidaminococcales bacterium]|jgi:RNA-splicing ligase RtcB|nr:RtcB family protein [Acidaminococcales bacterium]
MVTIQGKFNSAVCYTPQLEERAAEQIKTVCDQEAFAGCKIRIMPDVHAGKGCTIGTTMTIKDKIVPEMVGVDIGCGLETVRVDADTLDFARLDEVIRRHIPSGFDVRKTPHKYAGGIDLSELRCAKRVNLDRAYKSVGTLGGGNHFIEVGKSSGGGLYIVVHSGSRHLGSEVAEHYQTEGYSALCGHAQFQLAEMIAQLKAQGRHKEIQSTMNRLKSQTALPAPKDLAYVEGGLFDDYLHDMKIIQKFAVLNRKAMADTILAGMHLSAAEEFTTIHNYIDTDAMILRKGSVSAKQGEKLLIPINMRDGCLICVGKGNPDWNFSAPHGAGRLMSRSKAFNALTMERYQAEMSGIYSTCIRPETLDEAPMAYKPVDEIIAQIEPTAEIAAKIKPLYNFKAAEGGRRRR